MPRGYEEGPVAEAAEARRDALERGEGWEVERPTERTAVYGSTKDEPERHFIGWLGDVDPEQLFAKGKAWGLSLVRRTVD